MNTTNAIVQATYLVNHCWPHFVVDAAAANGEKPARRLSSPERTNIKKTCTIFASRAISPPRMSMIIPSCSVWNRLMSRILVRNFPSSSDPACSMIHGEYRSPISISICVIAGKAAPTTIRRSRPPSTSCNGSPLCLQAICIAANIRDTVASRITSHRVRSWMNVTTESEPPTSALTLTQIVPKDTKVLLTPSVMCSAHFDTMSSPA